MDTGTRTALFFMLCFGSVLVIEETQATNDWEDYLSERREVLSKLENHSTAHVTGMPEANVDVRGTGEWSSRSIPSSNPLLKYGRKQSKGETVRKDKYSPRRQSEEAILREMQKNVIHQMIRTKRDIAKESLDRPNTISNVTSRPSQRYRPYPNRKNGKNKPELNSDIKKSVDPSELIQSENFKEIQSEVEKYRKRLSNSKVIRPPFIQEINSEDKMANVKDGQAQMDTDQSEIKNNLLIHSPTSHPDIDNAIPTLRPDVDDRPYLDDARNPDWSRRFNLFSAPHPHPRRPVIDPYIPKFNPDLYKRPVIPEFPKFNPDLYKRPVIPEFPKFNPDLYKPQYFPKFNLDPIKAPRIPSSNIRSGFIRFGKG